MQHLPNAYTHVGHNQNIATITIYMYLHTFIHLFSEMYIRNCVGKLEFDNYPISYAV